MAVRSALHYALEVPDQQVGQRFYQDFGFADATGSANAVRLRPKPQAREQIMQMRERGWDPRYALKVWGSEVPPDFIHNREA